jgi:hypothetical protein
VGPFCWRSLEQLQTHETEWGPNYQVARASILTHADNALLAELAKGRRCSAAEVVRRLIRAEAKRLRRRQRMEQREAATREGAA